MRRVVTVLAAAMLLGACSSAASQSPLPTLPLLRTLPPSGGPTKAPTAAPSAAPTAAPSAAPTAAPTQAPTSAPTQAPTEAPTDSPAPTAPPTAPPTAAPTEEPSPSPSESADTGPLSEAALLASLLIADDVPSDMTVASGYPDVQDTARTAGFTENKGIRVALQQLEGTSPATAIYDIRWQFPTKSTARAFMKADNDLSEEDSGGLVHRTDSPGFGDESLSYAGTVDGKIVFNYLIRVKNVLGKVYVEGTNDLEIDTADDIADGAAFRMEQALVGPYPSQDESEVLNSVPPDIYDSCERVFEIYPAEIESVRCRPKAQPVTDYTLFATQKATDAAFDADLKANGNPTKTAKCQTGKYASGYTINGVHAGRLMCVTEGARKIIEWTDEQLFILSYASSTTLSWDDLYAYWNDDAGPTR